MAKTIEIPDSLKHDEDLQITFNRNFTDLRAIVYESPRAIFAEDDKKQEKPIWRGDVFEASHDDNISGSVITLKMRRGPENKRANYGKYLVKAAAKNEAGQPVYEEKLIIVLPKP